jgi:hypothetical protein
MARVAMPWTPSVLLGPAMPDLSTPFGHVTPGLMAVYGVARLHGAWPAAVFYPSGHPTPYAYERRKRALMGQGVRDRPVYSGLR